MRLYAIADLHLSLYKHKPMDIYGAQWKEHHLTIQQNWLKTIKDNDTVLIGGDISWAMTLEEAIYDLDFIHNLTGRKILIRGNHDYWWKSVTELNSLYNDMIFLQNNYINDTEYSICGTRGWACLEEGISTEHDRKMYRRELIRLEMSLKAAVANGAKKIIVLLHYPPMSEKKEASGFTNLIKQYPVDKVVYGHLHSGHHHFAVNETIDGVEYILTSSDFLDFCPIPIAI